MKAKDIKKEYILIDEIYKNIEQAAKRLEHKIFYHHALNVSDEVKLQLMNDGFIVHTGDWDGVMTDVLIIEW